MIHMKGGPMNDLSQWQQPIDPQFAVAAIDALDESDPESAHDNADSILLANIHPDIAAAYQRLIDRSRWWATA